MRYLRILSNSLVAGALATCYVLVLVLQLNPALSLSPARLAPVAATIGLFYTIHFTVMFYLVLVAGQLLAREAFSPAWLSVGVIAWLGAAASAAGAGLMWANVHTFELVLEPETVRRMTTGAIVLGGSAALFTIVAVARRYAGPSHGALGLSLLIVSAASIAAPLASRGRSMPQLLESHALGVSLDATPADRTARVTILAVDAGSLDLIANAAAEGRLPNFGRILDAGAVMHLATLHPTSAEAVWAAVATGKLPQKNGVRSAGIYRIAGGGDPLQLLPEFCFANELVRFGFLSEEPYTSGTLRTRTLWNILSTLGIAVGVVSWPLTYPAPAVRGYLVSDLYSRLAMTPSGIDDPFMLYPPGLQAETLPIIQTLAADAAPILSPSIEGEIGGRRRVPARTDRITDRLAEALAETRLPQVELVRYQSLDPIGHYFLRYAMPSAFGDVTDDERRRLGPVLESHYALIDEAIGRAIKALGPDDLLLVVSAYGMEPLGLGKRILERLIGDPDLSGTHEAAPDGFLMAYGAPVADVKKGEKGEKAAPVRRASVVDVVPTVLYFLGLPVGRDMDGYARADLFQPAFTKERPITFIPTYDR